MGTSRDEIGEVPLLFINPLPHSIQNHNLGKRKILLESFPILLGAKPAYDAYKVAKGFKHEPGTVFSATTEMAMSKAIELFGEAIPGVLIQLLAIATSEVETSSAAWMSLAMSALCAGFVAGTLSYDYDTDPTKRQNSPSFYGYVPSNASKRTIVFATMIMFSTGMLMMRSTAMVFFIVYGKAKNTGLRYFLTFLLGDISMFFVVKLLRDDFWHWIPVAGVLHSFGIRLITKVVIDFTSLIHFRHPNEAGAFGWSSSAVVTLASLVAVFLFKEDYESILLQNAGNTTGYNTTHLEQSQARNTDFISSPLLITYVATTAMAFTIFYISIEEEYRNTFFNGLTGPVYTQNTFHDSQDDGPKAQVTMTTNKRLWVAIEPDVRGWVEANWLTWVHEKPLWFDEQMQKLIPEEFIPLDAKNPNYSYHKKNLRSEQETSSRENGEDHSLLDLRGLRLRRGRDARVVAFE